MNVKQIYTLMNTVTSEILGNSAVVAEDLSNVVDVGVQVFNSSSVDNYVKSLVNHIGKMVFVNRVYQGSVPSVLMDGWEFGSVLEKVTIDLPEAEINESWELEDRSSYDPNVFYKPSVSAKFFNSRVTFEVPISITERQVKQSFSNVNQLNAFVSMIYNAVEKSLTVKIDALIMRTINNFTSETLYQDFTASSTALTAGSGKRAINLLYLYNTKFSKNLTVANCIYDKDFLRFAAYTINIYISRLRTISTRYNIGGKDRFTPSDMLHVVMLSDFFNGASVYLQSDTFHNELVKLPKSEIITQWQGSGNVNDEYPANATINVVNSSGHTINTTGSGGSTQAGILCVMFDRDALGVANMDRRVTTNYNPKAEFFNSWYKYDAGYFNDFNENFLVFFVA